MWLIFTHAPAVCGVQDIILFHSVLKRNDTKRAFCMSESLNSGSLTVSVGFGLLMDAVMLSYFTER